MRPGARSAEAYLVVTNRGAYSMAATKLVDIDRVRAILLQPGTTWKMIDAEFTKPAELYKKWILPLAAIGPVCSTISMILFGQRIAFTSLTNRVPFSTIVTRGITAYVLGVLAVFVLAQVINVLAPSFGGQKNDVQALKAAAYAATAGWIGGVSALIPALWPVGLLFSFYSLYLLYVGLPIVMKVPSNQTAGYTAVALVVALVILLLVSAITS
jgi:Yip1 domain